MPGINTFSWKRWQIFHGNNARRHREHSYSTKASFKAERKTLGATSPQSSPLKPPWSNSSAKGGSRTLQLEQSLSWQWDWCLLGKESQDSAGGTDKPICQGQPHFHCSAFSGMISIWSDRIILARHWLFWRWSFISPHSAIEMRHLPFQN